MIIHMILYLCKNIYYISFAIRHFFKNLRICSAKFGNSKSVWAHVTDWMHYLDYGVRKKRQMMLLNFLIIFWCSTRFLRDFTSRFFAYCTSSMKITIWIPVANLSLDQACIYHLRAHHRIEFSAQNNTNFYTFISASGTPSSHKK